MNPTDSSVGIPDLILKVYEATYEIYSKVILETHKGDVVSFKARISFMGDDSTDHILDLIKFEKTGKT